MPQNIYGYWQQEDASSTRWGGTGSRTPLAAYDLQTGRRLWRIGGRKIEDVFAPPLAGTYFFGAPGRGRRRAVRHRGVERRRVPPLPAGLDGEPLWSQQIAGVGQTISRDMVRRGWLRWPAIGEGIIVCPTTSGWLVAARPGPAPLPVDVSLQPAGQHAQHAGTGTSSTSRSTCMPGGTPAPILTDGTVLFGPSELPDETGSQQPVLIAARRPDREAEVARQAEGNSLVLAGPRGAGRT